MDNLTMECFASKKTYNKYLAKKDPTTFQKNETFHNELIQHHDELMELLSECILNPSTITNLKMRDTFNQLMIECIDVLTRPTEEKPIQEPEPEPDVLFSHCEDLGKNPTTIEYWKMQSVFKS
jgi:hypothetical protein